MSEYSEPTSWESIQLDGLPTVALSISSLLLDDSPRQDGENDDHVRVLAESEEQLPPIVVHGQSMRVIDGIHRVRAAVIRGEEEIKAKIFHGTDNDAFVLAVRMNIAHGLPLTRADRTAAAVRIIGSHPQWSNRMIATATGISAGTVGKLRQRSTVQNAQSTTRVGKDGRVRPLNSAAGRLKAGELLAEKPTASIRAIAQEAGVSPSTVHDVRQRLRTGRDTALEWQRGHGSLARSRPPDVCPRRGAPSNSGSAGNGDVATILATLKGDPSFRFSDAGRCLLRWLDRNRVEMAGFDKIAEMVPDHCTASVAKLARGYARVWTTVAARLEERWRQSLRDPASRPRTRIGE
ncbi:MAG: ParB N-terminal domain-containing protein [Actinomycetota bacterium]|nr:ParB N-terminal domain-containing protein [Actinomycetota bacterium]